MTLAEQAAAGVDREPAVDVGFAAFDRLGVLALFEQPQALDAEHLGDAEAVVDLGEVDLVGPDSGPLVGVLGGCPGQRLECHRGGFGVDGAGAQRRGGQLDCPAVGILLDRLVAHQDHCGGAVGDR